MFRIRTTEYGTLASTQQIPISQHGTNGIQLSYTSPQTILELTNYNEQNPAFERKFCKILHVYDDLVEGPGSDWQQKMTQAQGW